MIEHPHHSRSLLLGKSYSSRMLLWMVVVIALGLNAFSVADGLHPNVLWIMSDDLRPQLGCYGDTVVHSPNLDQFARRALRLDRAYVQCAICSPSRNSMLSGLRPNTTGLRGFGTRVRDVMPDVVTLPQHFRHHGYYSAAFGKIFHIYAESMLGSEDDPESWSQPLTLPSVPVWGPAQNAVREQLIAQARASGQVFAHPHDWPRAETWDDSDVTDDEMQDGNTTALAEAFLATRVNQDEPFFLAVGFLRPHLPFNAPRKYWDLYDANSLTLPKFSERPKNAPKWSVNQGIANNYLNMPPNAETDEAFLKRYLHAYLASISYVDACFGRLMRAIKASGREDNTIVIFMGDHGYQMGEYNSWGHKHANFEISTRAPLLIASPGMQASGKASQGIVEFLDLYPTLCELTHLPNPDHIEGKSFRAMLDDESASHRTSACSEMKRGDYLGRSIRTDGFRYTEWRDANNAIVARELYDHRDDQSIGQLETVNVAAEPAMVGIVEDLSRRLNEQVPATLDGGCEKESRGSW